GSNSEPLDVGRRVRLVTKAMRRALDARDRGCVVCGAPPIVCDAHHLISWLDGGDTKVSNLALLCRRHHTDVHRGHWHIRITNGIVHVARPSWAEPSPTLTAARRTAPPHAHPPGLDVGLSESESTAASPWAPEDIAVESVADRSRWRADEAALQQAAAFAATG
ncbi:MAG TPA: HNH endonuclease, partial [Kribbella sp.]